MASGLPELTRRLFRKSGWPGSVFVQELGFFLRCLHAPCFGLLAPRSGLMCEVLIESPPLRRLRKYSFEAAGSVQPSDAF